MKTIYLAGGCFWGMQKFFDQFDGVLETEAGYANGPDAAPSYKDVCAGSGHAETVKVVYDENVMRLAALLDFYFSVIDPLSVNRQGNDRGIQYRTGIYYTDENQLPEILEVYRAEEAAAGEKLAVELLPLRNFFSAEEYHQKYLDKNPGGYCHIPERFFHMTEKKKRRILIVVDMQNDFIDGVLGTSEALEIVGCVKEKIRSYDPEDVIATMDTHGENYLETQEGKNLPVPHCVKGTDGWQIRPEIRELLTCAKIYEKPAFGSTAMAADLKKLSEKEDLELELVGLCTDICVVSNALLLKAEMPEVPITVDAACCAGVTLEKHRAALETMRSCQIRVTGC